MENNFDLVQPNDSGDNMDLSTVQQKKLEALEMLMDYDPRKEMLDTIARVVQSYTGVEQQFSSIEEAKKAVNRLPKNVRAEARKRLEAYSIMAGEAGKAASSGGVEGVRRFFDKFIDTLVVGTYAGLASIGIIGAVRTGYFDEIMKFIGKSPELLKFFEGITGKLGIAQNGTPMIAGACLRNDCMLC